MDDGGGGAGAGKLPKVGKEKGSVISFPWGKKNMGQTINKASFPNQQLLPLICFVRQVFSTDENEMPSHFHLSAAHVCEQWRLFWWMSVNGTCTLVDLVVASKTKEWGERG